MENEKLEEIMEGEWIDVTPRAGTFNPKLYSPNFKSFVYKEKVVEKKEQTKSEYELEIEERNAWLDEKQYNQEHGSSWGVWCPSGPA